MPPTLQTYRTDNGHMSPKILLLHCLPFRGNFRHCMWNDGGLELNFLTFYQNKQTHKQPPNLSYKFTCLAVRKNSFQWMRTYVRSRSLYAILVVVVKYMLYAIPRPSVCPLSVYNARALYSGGWNFQQYFYGNWYLCRPLTSTENFTEIVPGEPLHRGS